MRRPLRGDRLLPCRESGETDMPDAAHMTALLNHYGYLAVLAGTFLEGETVLLVAGALAREGYMSLFWVGLSAFMGGLGSDAAIEAADIVLMDDQPTKIAAAIRIARKTVRIVRENIVFALTVKAIVLVMGALGKAPMWLAVFADVGVAFLAILNAMRCLYTEKDKK